MKCKEKFFHASVELRVMVFDEENASDPSKDAMN